jgi:hypothetical protein
MNNPFLLGMLKANEQAQENENPLVMLLRPSKQIVISHLEKVLIIYNIWEDF